MICVILAGSDLKIGKSIGTLFRTSTSSLLVNPARATTSEAYRVTERDDALREFRVAFLDSGGVS